MAIFPIIYLFIINLFMYLFIIYLFYCLARALDAWRDVWIFVRSNDAQ